MPPGFLSQLAITVLTSDEDFFEMLIYGVAFVFVVLLLFVVNKVLKVGVGRRVRDQHTPFGMSADDLDRLKQSGGLSDEELKRVKSAMAKKFLERAKAEEAARNMPAKAEILLAAAEQEVLRGKEPEPASAPPPTRPTLTRPPAAKESIPPAGPPPLPEKLQPLAGRSDLELEELIMAGFLTEEEAREVRAARQR